MIENSRIEILNYTTEKIIMSLLGYSKVKLRCATKNKFQKAIMTKR
ncbi:hypothetical protein H0A61_00620 [Koleobacter methoxysyntrophicus]|jgi:hypothetical protein|uniref:Uncharacterized protein n=1 Tax=Koleobacter methoxysyntrophicus TaxID=2751313 RepID=A0A8A0RL07_9FIRM|nr:hypothetical protein [Koleobacter methoxysyntrophicus]NPV43978.1 hypothetical protein [Bacillota bacterium]QSQ08300.1 hypothetical protein H0A61_00620 [Koleobacter methoxysyntrophicus]